LVAFNRGVARSVEQASNFYCTIIAQFFLPFCIVTSPSVTNHWISAYLSSFLEVTLDYEETYRVLVKFMQRCQSERFIARREC
jgi:hypothetical protein